MHQIDSLADDGRESPERELRAAALRAAHAVHERARFQQNQLARLRRRSYEVLSLPFLWEEQLGLDSIRRIGERLSPALKRTG